MAEARSVGFVGIGIMGSHMARRLAEAGHRVGAWNRTREKADRLAPFGVRVVDTADLAGAGAEVAIVMVADGPAADAVVFGAGGAKGLLDTLPKGAALVVMSSIPVATAQRQAEAAATRGLAYLDAPVSGGERGARDGKLVIMAGGEAAAFDALQDLFAVFGRATRVGPAGAGSLAKLANQVIVGNTIATVAEALLLAERGGADPAAVVAALTGGYADSPILQDHGRRMVRRDFEPGAPCRIQLKDTATAGDLAAELSLRLPVTAAVRAIFAAAVDNGLAERDHSAAYLELRRRNRLAES